jgi:ParB family chromosome partitioning protein
LFFDPATLTLVTDEKHPLYDDRVHAPLNESMVLNIMFQGVIQPIEVSKDPETGLVEVVTGRQRVKNAIEANRRLMERGLEPKMVPAYIRLIPRAQRAEMLSAAMVSENAIRTDETPIQRAAKMARQLNSGRSEEHVAVLFGCDVQTVRNTVALLDSTQAVQDAVEAGEITVSHARTLGKLKPEEQRAAVQAVKAASEGKTGHEKSRAQREAVEKATASATGKATPQSRIKTRKEIKAAMETATGERLAALRWVLGLDECDDDPQAAAPADTTADMFERDAPEASMAAVASKTNAIAWPFPSHRIM